MKLLFIIILLFSNNTQSKIYKCNKNGELIFKETPCNKTETKMKFDTSKSARAQSYPEYTQEDFEYSEYRSYAKNICEKNWTKRGELDQRMYDHCIEGQMEGYEKLKGLRQYASQDFYSKTAYPYCSNNWTKRGVVDARMLAHCLEQEIEGVEDVEYQE